MSDNKKNVPRIDQDITMNIFKRFAGVHDIDESIIEYIMLSGDAFWEYLINGWEAYASHAGRHNLEKADIQLHMLRIGLASNSNEFRALVASHLPPDLAMDVLGIASDQNIVEKNRRQ